MVGILVDKVWAKSKTVTLAIELFIEDWRWLHLDRRA